MAKHRTIGKKTVQRLPLVEYHVVPNGSRFDVERDDTFTGSFAYEINMAIGLAISAAQRDQHNGNDVMVCVQQPDGHCRKVWP
jgi:hypothetical protein